MRIRGIASRRSSSRLRSPRIMCARSLGIHAGRWGTTPSSIPRNVAYRRPAWLRMPRILPWRSRRCSRLCRSWSFPPCVRTVDRSPRFVRSFGRMTVGRRDWWHAGMRPTSGPRSVRRIVVRLCFLVGRFRLGWGRGFRGQEGRQCLPGFRLFLGFVVVFVLAGDGLRASGGTPSSRLFRPWGRMADRSGSYHVPYAYGWGGRWSSTVFLKLLAVLLTACPDWGQGYHWLNRFF